MEKLLLLIFLVLLLSGCGEPNVEHLSTPEEDYLEDYELGEYVEDVSYEIDEKLEDGLRGDYTINLRLKVKDSFDELENREKLLLFRSFYQDHLKLENTACGNNLCAWKFIIAETSSNVYVTDDETMSANGTEEYKWKDLVAEDQRKADEEELRQNAAEGINASNFAIHLFMKLEYDKLTKNGQNYIPEVHDPIVAKMAAKEFEITEEQALEIYTEQEVKGY